jgi:hypothetical protein
MARMLASFANVLAKDLHFALQTELESNILSMEEHLPEFQISGNFVVHMKGSPCR